MQYGIELPKSSKNINYYLVNTSSFDNRIVVYPDLCLQTSLPTVIKCNNKREITNRFFKDLEEKVTQICGQQVSFNFSRPESYANFVEPTEVIFIYLILSLLIYLIKKIN